MSIIQKLFHNFFYCMYLFFKTFAVKNDYISVFLIYIFLKIKNSITILTFLKRTDNAIKFTVLIIICISFYLDYIFLLRKDNITKIKEMYDLEGKDCSFYYKMIILLYFIITFRLFFIIVIEQKYILN